MKHHLALLVIVGALLAPAVAVPQSIVNAQSGGWTVPVQISGTTQYSWFPDIAVDATGEVHIVWASGVTKAPEAATGALAPDTSQTTTAATQTVPNGTPTGKQIVDLLMYRVLKDGQWSKTNDIVNPGFGGFAPRSSMIAGRDGELHLLVRSQARVDYFHAPDSTADLFQSWSTAHRINNLMTPYYDTMAIDSKGVLHALWNESVNNLNDKPTPDCILCTEVFYRHSADNGQTWSQPINISQMPEGSVKPQIQIDAQDHLHIVWEEGHDTLTGSGTPTAGVYRRSLDGGTTWEPPVRFVLPTLTFNEPTPLPNLSDPVLTPAPTVRSIPNAPTQIGIGLYKNTEPLIVFRSAATNRMYYATSQNNGGQWSSSIPIESIRARDSNDTPWDAYWMATDAVGNVHLMAVGMLASDTSQRPIPRLLHLVWNGQSWSDPEVVDPEESYPAQNRVVHNQETNQDQPVHLYPEWPRIAISDGNTLHIAWFTRDSQDRFMSDSSHYQVWYSTKKLDIAATAPLPTFTPAPTVAPPQPTVVPSPIPIPTLTKRAALAPQLNDTKQWERPGVRLVGLATLPIIGLLGLFVAVGLVVRRR